jgi:predicted hydrocarbon binding protein
MRQSVDHLPTAERKKALYVLGEKDGYDYGDHLRGISVLDSSVSGTLEWWVELKRNLGFADIVLSDMTLLDHLEPGITIQIHIEVRNSIYHDHLSPTLCHYMAGHVAGVLGSVLGRYHPQVLVECGCNVAHLHSPCVATAQITLERGDNEPQRNAL